MVTFGKDMPKETRKEMRGGPGEAQLMALSGALPGKMRLCSQITLTPGMPRRQTTRYHIARTEDLPTTPPRPPS